MAKKTDDQPEARKVRLGEIRHRPEFQVRERLHGPTVDRYVEILDQLPPVDLYKIDGELILVDGFHRVEAHRRVARAQVRERASRAKATADEKATWLRNAEQGREVPALIHTGSREDALGHAAEANVSHGRGLDCWDLYRAIAMHPLTFRVSLRGLASAMGTSHETARTALAASRMAKVAPAARVKRLTTREILQMEREDEERWPEAIEEVLAHKPKRNVPPGKAMTDAIVAMQRLAQHAPERVVKGMASKRVEGLVDELADFIATLAKIQKEARRKAAASVAR